MTRAVFLDPDMLVLSVGPTDRGCEATGGSGGNLNPALPFGDLDPADLGRGDMATPAEKGHQPARIGIVGAAHIHAKPDRSVVAFRHRPAKRRSRRATLRPWRLLG